MLLYNYFKEWRKNPQWSFPCCLALLVPLNDFQGKLSGFAETNVLQNQLQTGQMEMPTILNAVQDSGAIDVTLEEDEKGDDSTVDWQESNYQGVMYSARRHQETQTELFVLPSARLSANEPLDEKEEKSVSNVSDYLARVASIWNFACH